MIARNEDNDNSPLDDLKLARFLQFIEDQSDSALDFTDDADFDVRHNYDMVPGDDLQYDGDDELQPLSEEDADDTDEQALMDMASSAGQADVHKEGWKRTMSLCTFSS